MQEKTGHTACACSFGPVVMMNPIFFPLVLLFTCSYFYTGSLVVVAVIPETHFGFSKEPFSVQFLQEPIFLV